MTYPILAEKNTWYTQGGTTTPFTTFTIINIVDSYTPTGSESESWDASANKDGSIMAYITGTTLTIAGNGSGKITLSQNASDMFRVDKVGCTNVTAINGLELFDVSNTTDISYVFYGFNKVTTLNVGSWDVSNVTNMYALFYACNSLTSLDISRWNVGNVTNMQYIFYGCSTIATFNISEWDTSNVTTIRGAFYQCTSLTTLDVSKWNTDNLIVMRTAFYQCSSLTSLDVSKWNTGNVTDMCSMFYRCSSLTSLDVSKWDTSNVTDMSSVFEGCSKLTSIDVDKWNTSKVTNMSSLFASCRLFTTLNVSNFDTSNVINMSSMFYYCDSLTTLDLSNFNTSNVTNMFRMFFSCKLLATIIGLSNFDTGNVTNMEELFFYCKSITSLDIGNWDTSKVTNMYWTFCGCDLLTTIDVGNWNTSSLRIMTGTFASCPLLTSVNVGNWDTSNVVDMRWTFQSCPLLTSIDVSNWDTSSVTTMNTMFYDCTSLTSLDVSNWDTSNVADMKGIFYNCTSLTSLDTSNWNTGKVTDMYAMFYKCTSLTSLDTSNWDTSSVTDMTGMFAYCKVLTDIDVSNWDTCNVTTMADMFRECFTLTFLDTSNWNVSKVQNFQSMFCGESYKNSMKVKINTSNWDTSSATNLSFMFYGAGGTEPDVSNWDVSKVTTFDHMFAHSYMKSPVDTSKWDTSSAESMYALFYSIQAKVINVSSFDTSKVTVFGQMFEGCGQLERIVGLEKFDTSQGVDFSEMFYRCTNLKELDLSSFDTRKATEGIQVSPNGGIAETMVRFFGKMEKLEKISLGENFSFKGDGTTTNSTHWASIPDPDPTKIRRACGKWYNESDQLIDAIPDMTAGTYYAVPSKYRKYVLVTQGSLEDVANGIRSVTGETTKYYPEDMGAAIANIQPQGPSIDTTEESKRLGNVVSGDINKPLDESIDTIEQLNADLENIMYGIDSGGKSQYDVFWDSYQTNGTRANYNYAFYGSGWNDITFKPKYDIAPSSSGNTATQIFQGCYITDLSALLEAQKVKIDLSAYKGGNAVAIFHSSSKLTKVPMINVPSTANYGQLFYNCPKLHTVEGLLLSEEGTQTFHNDMFYNCTSLKNIVIVGVIGNNINFQYSPLTKESILGKVATEEQIEANKNIVELNGVKYYGGIIAALKADASGKTLILKASAVNNAFETSIGVANGSTSQEWLDLIATKSNWTISLV